MSKRQNSQRMLYGLVAVFLLALGTSAQAMPAPGDLGIADATVAGNTGAAHFRIPIAVPPGPRGFQPELEIVYSSHGTDGPWGVGWRLNISSEIRCSIRFGVPDYSNCERYELDGQLLTHNGASDETARYHTFVESFQRIVYDSMNDSWRVTSTDGTVRHYGLTANARIQAPGGETARWLLGRIDDTFTNRIDIAYDRSDTGVGYPSTITYADGERKVTFAYGSRPDPIHDFLGGIEREATKRLQEIQVTSGSGGNEVVFQRRVFRYATPPSYTTERTRLAETQLYGTDCSNLSLDPTTSCTGLPKETFEYTDPNDHPNLTANQATQAAQFTTSNHDIRTRRRMCPGSQELRNTFGDIDGDGLIDKLSFPREMLLSAVPCIEPEVLTKVGGLQLNTGSEWGPSSDPDWEAALDALRFDYPGIRFTMVQGTNSTEISKSGLAYSDEAPFGICDAEPFTVSAGVLDAADGNGPAATVTPLEDPVVAPFEAEVLARGACLSRRSQLGRTSGHRRVAAPFRHPDHVGLLRHGRDEGPTVPERGGRDEVDRLPQHGPGARRGRQPRRLGRG